MVFRVLIAAAVALHPLQMFGQTSGTLRGSVIDPSGAAIPNVQVVLTGPNRVSRSASSDATGSFSIAGLTPGQYSIQATAPGFGEFRRSMAVPGGQVSTLEIHLALALDRQEVTVADTQQNQVAVDPSQNATAVTITKQDLDALSDSPDDLAADLLALAGPSVGPNGGELFIDGFSNGQLPPKESIREVRINSNPFSAEYDRPGAGRIEIITKAGAEKFNGSASGSITDSAANARNPFTTEKLPARALIYDGGLTGPLGSHTSFTLEGGHQKLDSTALINADALDSSYQIVHVNQPIRTPSEHTYLSPRLDVQISPNMTFQSRYYFDQSSNRNSGAGGLTLLSRTTDLDLNQQSVQMTLTEVGARTANETLFQFNRFKLDNLGDSSTPSISVLGSFLGGGATVSKAYTEVRNSELQNNTSYTRGRNFLRFGVRVRWSLRDDYSTSNFNGTYTFTSLNAYALTLQGLAQGLPMDQIRVQGGGPSQYSVAGGQPLAAVQQLDAAPYIQDDFKVAPNFTLSAGARYEYQTNIHDSRSSAPRVGIAWGIGKRGAATSAPKTVLRLGYGIYYSRVDADLTLQTHRQNGIAQQSFLVPEPLFFPVAPPVSQLIANRQPQAIREMESVIRAPQILQAAATVERQLRPNLTIALNFTDSRGVHQLRSRNINAPLPGSGIYPFGTAGQIFLYESSALFKQQQASVNINARLSRRFSIVASYTYNQAKSNADSSGEFPMDNYDLSGEWGRARYDIRHRIQLNGNIVFPMRLQVSPNISYTTAPPFSVTTGEDNNGDSNYNDRPAYTLLAPDPARGVIATPWGVFNKEPLTNPAAGTIIAARNSVYGFSALNVNGRVSRTWNFGEGNRRGDSRYSLTLGVQARNWINTVNRAAPVGNLSSPLLGQSLNIVNGGSNANRRLEFNLRLNF